MLALGSCLSLWVAASASAGEAGPGTCKLAPPTLARLGYASLPVELSRADLESLKQAQKAVRKKDLAAAKKLVDPLAATYSEDPEVRFLLATVHASEGWLSDACGEIGRLLELDLPAFAQRFEHEPALASLRASADGSRLAEHAKAIGTLWRQATSDGLPAVMSRGSRGSQEIWLSRFLRGGVYLHDIGRFLPVEPGIDGANGVLVDPKANTVAVAKMNVIDCRDDYCPRIDKVEVRAFRLDDVGQPPSRWHYQGEDAHTLDLRSGPRGLTARVHDCCCYKGCVSPWETVGAKRPTPTSTTKDELSMRLDVRGWLLALTPAGQQVRKGRLVSATGEVQLAAKHGGPLGVHEIFVDRNTGLRWVLTTADGCDPKNPENPILRHVISKVAPDGKATVLIEGKGPATALLDGKQAFYLQSEDTVRRWPSLAAFGSGAGEKLMPGVLLVVPISENSNCGGL